MKRQFLILIAIAAFATTLTANALGQTGKAVKANVKFDFNVGERTFPAGEYRIESISLQNDNILEIRSVRDLSKIEIIVANHLTGQKQMPRLVFQKYGEDYFLTSIFLDTDQWGYSIRPSRRQHESEKNLALASLKTAEVRLAK
ncbi:MAG: hypothetical protein ACMG6H_16590 [Acidobacteriota bacterium]